MRSSTRKLIQSFKTHNRVRLQLPHASANVVRHTRATVLKKYRKKAGFLTKQASWRQ